MGYTESQYKVEVLGSGFPRPRCIRKTVFLKQADSTGSVAGDQCFAFFDEQTNTEYTLFVEPFFAPRPQSPVQVEVQLEEKTGISQDLDLDVILSMTEISGRCCPNPECRAPGYAVRSSSEKGKIIEVIKQCNKCKTLYHTFGYVFDPNFE